MLKGKKIFVVMPAYNAARTLSQTFRELPHSIVDGVLLVDDHSSDSTLELVRQIGLTTFVQAQIGYWKREYDLVPRKAVVDQPGWGSRSG